MRATPLGAALALTLGTVVVAVGVGIGSSTASSNPPPEGAARAVALQAGVGEARRAALPAPDPERPLPDRASRATTAPDGPPFLGEFEVTCYALRGITATGRQVGQDVVAVDPRVIPYGSRIYIEDVGQRVAADTGRVIKGNRLDIWASSAAVCRQFGRQWLDVHLTR